MESKRTVCTGIEARPTKESRARTLTYLVGYSVLLVPLALRLPHRTPSAPFAGTVLYTAEHTPHYTRPRAREFHSRGFIVR